MVARSIGAALLTGAALAGGPALAAGGQDAAAPPSRALFDRYCVACHNQRLRTGGLALDEVDPARAAVHAPVLEKVVRKLRTGQMPPEGRPRPAPAGDRRVRDPPGARARPRGGGPTPTPARVASRRLNRVEYVHVVEDLLGLEVDGGRTASLGHGRVRLRQQRRRAVDHAGADVPLHGGRDQDQPGRGRQPRRPSRHAALPGGLRAARRAGRRGPAVRDPRRARGAPPLPPGRRVRLRRPAQAQRDHRDHRRHRRERAPDRDSGSTTPSSRSSPSGGSTPAPTPAR